MIGRRQRAWSSITRPPVVVVWLLVAYALSSGIGGAGCNGGTGDGVEPDRARPDQMRMRADVSPGDATPKEADDRASERLAMVSQQIAARGVRDPSVLEAMRRVPRHEFMPEDVRDRAYRDGALPIGEDQTISQPYIVALMTELAALDRDSKVLEIGTGSGYQAAVLAEVAGEVFTIEIVEPLALRAARTLTALGYERVHVRTGDGWAGWPEAAPFDAIVVTAAPERVPPILLEQLATDGRLVIPVGGRLLQNLEVHRRSGDGFTVERVIPVMFVPLTGGDDRAVP